MKRVKIGDIVEIKTAKGLSYAQYSHKHKMYGALLRVFNKPFEKRPEDFTELINEKPSFLVFFPLGAAVNRGIFPIAGNVAVPEEAQAFPLFRSGTPDPNTGKVAVWWLWDGENEWRVGQITSEQRKLSIRGIVNDTFLIKRIEDGWTPETDTK